MARTAMTELQQQIEAVRREAFAAGYAAAMEAIREATSRAAPGAGSVTSLSNSSRIRSADTISSRCREFSTASTSPRSGSRP